MLLRREGHAVNRKRTCRLYREGGVSVRRRKRGFYAPGERRPLRKPSAPNIRVGTAFVSDDLADDKPRNRRLFISPASCGTAETQVYPLYSNARVLPCPTGRLRFTRSAADRPALCALSMLLELEEVSRIRPSFG